MGQGQTVQSMVEYLIDFVRLNGHPVTVNRQGTIEALHHSFAFSYSQPIDMTDIHKQMEKFYKLRNIDAAELYHKEFAEYSKIENVLRSKLYHFEDDLNSRRVLWTDDCCISMIHFLIREDSLICYATFRSSDVVLKLFMDLMIIHRISRIIQKKFNLQNVSILVTANSLHEIAIADIDSIHKFEEV